MSNTRILILDDDEGIQRYCFDTLRTLGKFDKSELTIASDVPSALEILSASDYSLLISDIQMPGATGIELLQELREQECDLPVIIMTGFPSLPTAVEALRCGAADYLTKPFLPDDLVFTVNRILETQRLTIENVGLRRQLQKSYQFDEIVGQSLGMQKIFDTIQQVALSNVDILITGETGTGKELVAKAIHNRSARGKQPFIPVNCGAIPETLMESEFFGYEKGAFTGAEQRTIGLLELADEGTFFLDEIGELPLIQQAKLLRALQERQFRRVGGKELIDVDTRIIAATGVDLYQEMQENRFREDLFYRINVVHIQLPPLRERGSDIELIADHLLARASLESAQKITGISEEAREVLLNYHWPGNVRELHNVMRRCVALARDTLIDVDDLPEQIVLGSGQRKTSGVSSFFEAKEVRINQFEVEYLTQMLELHNGRVTDAAQTAEIPVGTYYRLLKKHGISAGKFR